MLCVPRATDGRAVRTARCLSGRRGSFPLFVGDDLQVGKKRWNALYFVQNGASAELGEKSPGIGFGKLPRVGRLETDVSEPWKRCPPKRCLSGLPRPGHRDERVFSEQFDQAGRDFAFDHGSHCNGNAQNRK